MPITNTPRPLTARDAEKRILDLAAGNTTARNERAIVDTLAALPVAERGECLRLLEGRNSHHGLDHILRDDVDDVALRNEALLDRRGASVHGIAGACDRLGHRRHGEARQRPNHQGRRLPGCCGVVRGPRRRQRRHRRPCRHPLRHRARRCGGARRPHAAGDGIDVGSISYGNTFSFMLAGVGI